MVSLSYLLCVFVSLLDDDPAVSCHVQSKPEGEHKTLFVFGDSLFDSGNNKYLNSSVEGGSISWPYGETFFNHSTGRLSVGRLVPDFVGK